MDKSMKAKQGLPFGVSAHIGDGGSVLIEGADLWYTPVTVKGWPGYDGRLSPTEQGGIVGGDWG